jgi:hypothetical protein
LREHFSFYGITLEVSSPSATLVEQVRRDFLHFHTAPKERVDMRLELLTEPPRYDGLPVVRASVITPRNVCFRDGNISYIDYFGRALSVFNRGGGECRVWSTDEDLLHEIAYLFFLSTVGEHLDHQRMHRIHALGLSFRDQGVLLLLPSGGGKSTTAINLLRRPEFLLLGEDTPLIDRRGWMLPFPLRLGIRADASTDIPPNFLRTMKRMEFEPKTLIDLDYFKGRIGTAVPSRMLIVGTRYLGDVSEIVPLARRHAFGTLVSNMVVGLGVYQGLEFLLERSVVEIAGKMGVVSSRLYNALRLLNTASVYRFKMGRDVARNTETLATFITEKLGVRNEVVAPVAAAVL